MQLDQKSLGSEKKKLRKSNVKKRVVLSYEGTSMGDWANGRGPQINVTKFLKIVFQGYQLLSLEYHTI